ncbi:MAG: alpha/beta hydrolase [Rhodospirillaceae bacterium]|nr:alpha/beta hydrolase [Rhodospirillaceae bacterium]
MRPLVLLPGRSEFIEKYQEVAGDLARAGWTVHLLEWRGQGLSHRATANPQALWVDDFATHLRDLFCWMDRVVGAPSTAQPVPVLAHSMGGCLAILALAEAPQRFTCAVLTAPMLAILPWRPNRLIRWLARRQTGRGLGLRYAWGQRDFHRLNRLFVLNTLTGDRRRFAVQSDRFAEDSAYRVGGATWGWLDAAYRAMAEATAALPTLTRPVTILVGGRDRLVDNRPARAAGRLPHVAVQRFPQGRHELLMERDEIRRKVIEAVRAALCAQDESVQTQDI